MELPMITVEPHRARKAVAEYRRSVNERVRQDIRQLRRAVAQTAR